MTEPRVRTEVESRFDNWMSSVGAEIIDVPYSSINWAQIVEASIWREALFTYDDKNVIVEKGFRDTLILESVLQFCRDVTDTRIAFLCDDEVFRDTADIRLDSNPMVSVYESFQDFTSYILLLQEDLTEEFVRSIRGRARSKFFTEGNRNSLVYRERLVRRILDEFKIDLVPPDSQLSTQQMLFGAGPTWEPTGQQQITVGETRFSSKDEPRTYHWQSELAFSSIYRMRQSDSGTSLILQQDEQLLVLRIAVHWHADVRTSGGFYDMEIDRLEKIEQIFRAPDENLLVRYGPQQSTQQL